MFHVHVAFPLFFSLLLAEYCSPAERFFSQMLLFLSVGTCFIICTLIQGVAYLILYFFFPRFFLPSFTATPARAFILVLGGHHSLVVRSSEDIPGSNVIESKS